MHAAPQGEHGMLSGRNPIPLDDRRLGRTEHEQAVQEALFTRRGITRIADYAFDVAEGRGKNVVSATKSNGIIHSMPFWDEVVGEVAANHPDVTFRSEHIDALAAKLVLDPRRFDVLVASNLFGEGEARAHA